MNTPKYSLNPTRSVSPLRGSTSTKPKYYSSEDVNKIVRNSFQPKITFLMEQLQQRQQTIAKLNNKLNQNDEKLIQQSNLIENYLKKQKQMPNIQSYVVSTINQIINDKMKQHWEVLSSQIKKISQKLQQKFDQKKLEGLIQTEMERIKDVVVAFIETNKKKSNSYWQKIKDALNKINAKIAANEKDIIDINMKIDNFQTLRNKDRQTILELQNSKNVVKNFIQLKKSVQNIYENYQAVLSLQKGFKQRLEQQNGDSLWNEADFFKEKKSNLLPQEIVGLQYSKDQDIGFDIFDNKETKRQEVIPSPIKTINNQSLSVDMVHLHKTTPYGKDQSLFSLNTSQNQINSRIQNNTLLINLSLQTRKEMAHGVKQRLLELIQIKNWQRPLEVRYDEQINYLKNTEGNYLFDLKGNMFKINLNELRKLQQEKIVIRSRKQQMSSSKIKLTHC